jgi:hypothetical protein
VELGRGVLLEAVGQYVDRGANRLGVLGGEVGEGPYRAEPNRLVVVVQAPD